MTPAAAGGTYVTPTAAADAYVTSSAAAALDICVTLTTVGGTGYSPYIFRHLCDSGCTRRHIRDFGCGSQP